MLGFGVLSRWAVSTPHLYDTGELAAAAWQLTASHPPGQPLYALVAFGWTKIPLGNILLRTSLLSLFCEGTAAMFAARLTRSFVILSNPHTNRGWIVAAQSASALCVFLAQPCLLQSLRPEVYGLALATTLFSIERSLAFCERPVERPHGLYQAAFLGGITSTVHLPHALVALAVTASVFVVLYPKRPAFVRHGVWMFVAILIGLLPNLLLPLRARNGAPMWGDPTSLSGFLSYVSAAAYRSNLSSTHAAWLTNIPNSVRYIAYAAGYVPLLGACVWFIFTQTQTQKRFAVLLAACFSLLGVLLQPLVSHNPDNLAYFAPVLALWSSLGIAGFTLLHERSRKVAAVLLLVCGVNVFAWRETLTLMPRNSTAIDTLAFSLIDTPTPRAFVLTETDFVASSWWLDSQVDRVRPDVAVMVQGLATSSWHWESLSHHPLYDGRPRLGHGTSTEQRLVDGAVQTALRHVDIFSEADGAVNGRGRVIGSYLWIAPRGVQETERSPVATDAPAERLTSSLKDQMCTPQATDFAVIRWNEMERARRLFMRRDFQRAWTALALAAYPFLEQIALGGELTLPRHAPPPVVRSPDVFLASAEDAVRQAAVYAWVLGAPQVAQRLLEAQQQRADNLSLVQLAWLYLSTGNVSAAQRALQMFRATQQAATYNLSVIERAVHTPR